MWLVPDQLDFNDFWGPGYDRLREEIGVHGHKQALHRLVEERGDKQGRADKLLAELLCPHSISFANGFLALCTIP